MFVTWALNVVRDLFGLNLALRGRYEAITHLICLVIGIEFTARSVYIWLLFYQATHYVG